jgi:hypothetical protein
MDIKKLFACSFIVIAVLLITASFEGRGQKPGWEEGKIALWKQSAQYLTANRQLISLINKTERNYGRNISLFSQRFKVDRELMIGIVATECSGEKINKPMQTIAIAARQVGVKNHYNVYGNMLAGTKYLKYLLGEFKSQDAAIAAYNLGPTKVKRLLRRRKGFKPKRVYYVKKVNEIKKMAEMLS